MSQGAKSAKDAVGEARKGSIKMRILHILPTASPVFGGPIEGVIRTSLIDESLGYVRTIASLDLPDDPWVKECPIEVVALGKRSYSQNLGGTFWERYGQTPHMVPWLIENAPKYDAVIVNGLWNYASFAARQAFKVNKVPYFVFPHGMLDPWFKKTYPLKHAVKQALWLWSEGKLLRDAQRVFFTTEDERVLARGSFTPYNVREQVVGYGTADVPPPDAKQAEAFAALAPGVQGKRFLLFLSRIHKKKGCDLLIGAFARVAEKFPDVELVVAGPDQVGLRKVLERQVEQLGIASRVHWLGMVKGDAKWGAYRACEAFILPSHQENFGIVVAEAMAIGRPVLISNKVNIWREVEKGQAGFIAEDDEDGTVSLIERFLSLSPDEKARMGQAARACFEENFDVKNTSRTITTAITNALKRNEAA